MTNRIDRDSLVLSDAANSDSTAKLKKLSLDYYAGGFSLRDVVAAAFGPSQAADVEDF